MRAYEKPDLVRREPLAQVTARYWLSPPVAVVQEDSQVD